MVGAPCAAPVAAGAYGGLSPDVGGSATIVRSYEASTPHPESVDGALVLRDPYLVAVGQRP
jgi:hypothetical protein